MRPFIITRDIFLIAVFILILLAWKEYLSWWWIIGMILFYGSILFLGAVDISWNFFIASMLHGDRNKQFIALSFDDGPASYTEAILDILKAETVPGAFFCIGRRASASPAIVRRLHEEGHIIGNHSYHHGRNFDWKNRDEMAAEINQTNRAIADITGKKPLLFRPPYGVTNPELSQAVSLTGMTSIGWSLRSFDTTARDNARLLDRLHSKLKNGDIILLHDSEAITAAVLTAFIQSCRQKGFTFVRLDELLGIDAYA